MAAHIFYETLSGRRTCNRAVDLFFAGLTEATDYLGRDVGAFVHGIEPLAAHCS